MNNINSLTPVTLTQQDFDAAKQLLQKHEEFVKGWDWKDWVTVVEEEQKGWFGKTKIVKRQVKKKLPVGYEMYLCMDYNDDEGYTTDWTLSTSGGVDIKLEFCNWLISCEGVVEETYLSDVWFKLLVEMRGEYEH
ncbi:hypothetical protein M316_0027 [Nitrincola phage 1M3-16]|uniref:hypothetical protein n=1 Tax=Nitrincola phage 1M3-16 TaxID=1472912 RepID=UPI000444EC55|nr:hypothetical protein GJ22_gp125 [Nitrincola phage 1M3-16]AHX01092.1 hypothetical protein M316_0027 [Nitrincola phage 1M3-16]